MYYWINVVVFPFPLVLSSWVHRIVSLYIQQLHTSSGKKRVQWLQVLLLLIILSHHNMHFCEVTIQIHPGQILTQLQYKAWKKHQFRDRVLTLLHSLSNYLLSFPYFALILSSPPNKDPQHPSVYNTLEKFTVWTHKTWKIWINNSCSNHKSCVRWLWNKN